MALDLLVAAIIGAAVGIGEIVSLYRDAPSKALESAPAVFYVLVNAVASLTALALTRVFGWHFGIGSANSEAQRWGDVIVSGFGALVILRSSLFNVKVGDKTVSIGPGALLQVILDASDRALDRVRGIDRASAVSKIMQGIDFDKARATLPPYCIALMQNLSPDDQIKLRSDVDALAAQAIAGPVKVLILGLLLLNTGGEGVLRAAVDSLGNQIK